MPKRFAGKPALAARQLLQKIGVQSRECTPQMIQAELGQSGFQKGSCEVARADRIVSF
jgi:hypothetical protein